MKYRARSFLLILACILSFPAAAQSIRSSTDDSKAPWDLFSQACLTHTQDIAQWTADKNYLDKNRVTNAGDMAKVNRWFVYPGDDRPLAMWSLHNSYVTLVQYENQGCAVISDSYLSPDIIAKLMQQVAKNFATHGDRPDDVTTRIDQKHNGFYFILPVGMADNSPRHYVVVRTFPDGYVSNIKTMFYYFQSARHLNFQLDDNGNNAVP